ncbi:hypothetical protein GCM10007940_20150 [Portibacter lacus]|uniref:Sulfatase-modifying factor enzyme-like domain-containing protein n=2 Tax=Portibacter lacus TaxID=1099794 RepID=A0AA37WFX6_9BACT|nr:hypothetical protein GCM10007940_20150 [Portibacter lacus]
MTQTIPGTEVSFNLELVTGNDSIPDFYMGTHEIPHDLYVLFKRKEFDNAESDLLDDYSPDAVTRPSPPYEDMTWGMGEEGGFPMVSMTQQGALRFCQWLYLKTGQFFRLPTPEEWTYVAAQLPNKDGWFAENSEDKFHKTGLISNGNGFYDMFGNVTEWTLDRKILKGGSFIDSREDIDANTVIKYDRAWQQRDPQIPKSIWWLTDGSFVGFRVIHPRAPMTKDEIEAFFAEHIK